MDQVPDKSPVFDIKQILSILPHRYPFLLVDRVLEMDVDKGYILAQKNVTFNEAFFQGHFPQAPIMPGVLILEALAQAGGILVHLKGQGDKIAILLNVNQAKFRHPVKPGDVLLLRGQGLHFSSKGGRIKAEALVNDKIAAEAEIGFVFVDKNQI
ncbi:3-hydroxyacyl-ACP dehydratase FabZ [Candidatus Protochlamydia phocaeensis]|uniref:3-hydroxyacyl-ACP dehydratase FabZ n=1 Tax=Candidatus Protochlamydia phocaeensis TaxID=1414722 RepID=UPI0008395857|nr:3-hydroxyacyl-ACP dehydratase FabZ [Candidatus Protochlamydia phocaeensis]